MSDINVELIEEEDKKEEEGPDGKPQVETAEEKPEEHKGDKAALNLKQPIMDYMDEAVNRNDEQGQEDSEEGSDCSSSSISGEESPDLEDSDSDHMSDHADNGSELESVGDLS